MVTGMPKHFVRKTFDRWLAHRAAQFHHPPRIVLQRKRYIELQFSGITPANRCTLSTEGMVGIYASYQGEWWDGLGDFDVSERRTSTGQYYCHLCTDPEMFPSLEALWVTHSFEPLLAWTNEHFQASQWLWLCCVEGVTWAGLTPMADLHTDKTAADLVYACPVVRGQPSRTPGA
jgi:hypothetical protein